jgi:hypothetical protein
MSQSCDTGDWYLFLLFAAFCDKRLHSCDKAINSRREVYRCDRLWAGVSRARITRCSRKQNMRKIVLATAVAVGALALSACSEKTQEAASDTADSMAADAQSNMNAAGDAVAGAADDAAAAVNNAGDAADAAGNAAEAQMQDESPSEAAAD